MICTTCATAADAGAKRDRHCNDAGCACQHKPVGTGQELATWSTIVAVPVIAMKMRRDDVDVPA